MTVGVVAHGVTFFEHAVDELKAVSYYTGQYKEKLREPGRLFECVKDLFDVFVAVSGVEGQIYDLVVRITEGSAHGIGDSTVLRSLPAVSRHLPI